MNKAYILQHNTTTTKTSSCHLIHLLDRYPPKDSPEALDEMGALLRIRSDLKSALKASNPNPLPFQKFFFSGFTCPPALSPLYPPEYPPEYDSERGRGGERGRRGERDKR